jgi:hypothetical protein
LAGFSNLLGIDAFLESDVGYGDWLKVEKARIEDLDPGQKWDVIMFHHSFEHVPDPRATLAAAAERLSVSGKCLIRLPLISSWAWRHYGTNWVQLDAPRHLYSHSQLSLAILGAQCGLAITESFWDSTEFQFWGSEQVRRGIAVMSPKSYGVNPAASEFSRRDIDEFRRRARRLNDQNMGDQAGFVLERRS